MRKKTINCIYCSSEDFNYPFNNLFNSSLSGWISGPNPKYPIIAVIDLRGDFILNELQIVSHETMITTKIDIYISNNPDLNGVGIDSNNFFEYKNQFNWKNVGFFCFSSNERSNWVAREFKKVALPSIQASYIMFSISKCHRDVPGNAYNKVSIVSLNLIGTHLYRPRFGLSLLEMYDDLMKAKNLAIQTEEFAQADLINIQIENTKRNQDLINSLFHKKQIAMEKEEFMEVDSIIAQIYSIINQPIKQQQNTQPNQQQRQQQQQKQQQQNRQQVVQNENKQTLKANKVTTSPEASKDVTKKEEKKEIKNNEKETISKAKNENKNINEKKKEDDDNASNKKKPPENSKSSKKQKAVKKSSKDDDIEEEEEEEEKEDDEDDNGNEEEDDDGAHEEDNEEEDDDDVNEDDDGIKEKASKRKKSKTVKKQEKSSSKKSPKNEGKRNEDEEEEEEEEEENDDDSNSKSSKEQEKSPSPKSPKKQKSPQEKPDEQQGDEESKKKVVDPLTDEAIRESEYLIQLFGENTVAMAYSENWEVKSNGLISLCDKIKNLKDKKTQKEALQSMLPLFHKMFSSKLKATYVQAVDQSILLIDELKENGTFSGKNAFPRKMVRQLLNLSLSKLSSTNAHINKASMKFVKWASKVDKMLMVEIAQFTLKPPQKQRIPIMEMNKLDLLSTLFKENNDIIVNKLEIKDVMQFFLRCLDSPNEDVRGKAIKFYVTCREVYGNKVTKYIEELPKTIKSELIAATEAKS